MAVREELRVCAEHYLRGGDARHPLASPVYGVFEGLPPMLLVAGGSESLVDDTLRVAELARAAGVHVEVELVPGMVHVFSLFAGDPRLPEAQVSIERIGVFVRSCAR